MTDPYAGLAVEETAPAPAAAPNVAAQGAAGTYHPSSALTPEAAQSALDTASATLERSIAHLPDRSKEYARNKFFQNPTIAALRVASATPVSAKQGAHAGPPIHSLAPAIRAVTDYNPITAPLTRNMSDDQLNSLAAGFSRGVPGSERLAAGAEYALNNPDNQSYGDVLNSVRGQTDETVGKAPGAGLAGEALGAGATGVAGGELLGAVAEGTPAAAALARASAAAPIRTALATQAAGGAAGAGVGALDQDKPVLPAAAEGAVLGPALGATAKLGGFLMSKAADVLGLSSAENVLKTLTSASRDAIKARVDALTAKGIQPTLFEVLPLVDRNRIAKTLVSRSDNTLAATQDAIGNRVGNIGTEMRGVVENATAPGRQNITTQMTDDMVQARGGTAPAPGDAASAAFASRDPIALDNFRQSEDRAIMSPFDDQELYPNFHEIVPQHPEMVMGEDGQPTGEVHMVSDDPAVTEMLRRKAGVLTRKNANETSGGLTGRNISDLLGNLRDTASRGGTDADVAGSAIAHIEDLLGHDHPDFLDANEQMRAANAARARMQEGMSEGSRTRTRADIGDVTQPSKNAYNSTEGTQGRFLGQSNKLANDFGNASPREAIAGAASLPGDVAAIRGNLGTGPTDEIASAAADQTQGARALAGLSNKKGTDASELSAGDLAGAVLGLNPASMIRTKVQVISSITRHLGVPEAKARYLVDLLFSTDGAQRDAALAMLRKIPKGPNVVRDISTAIGAGVASQKATTGTSPEAAAPAAPAPAVDQGAPDPYAGMATEEAAPVEQPAPPTTPETAAPEPAPADQPAPPPTGYPGEENLSPAGKAIMEQIRAATDAGEAHKSGVPYGHAVVQSIFPGAHITSDVRSPNDPLSKKNPGSYHVKTDKAVDVRPIPGMSFGEFIGEIHNHGYDILEARDEARHPIPGLTTGKHWHVVIG